MSFYMNQLFGRSNSSFRLCRGAAVKAEVVRVSKDEYLLDSGLGRGTICKEDELTGVPNRQGAARFETKAGFLQTHPATARLIPEKLLERLFIDSMAGSPEARAWAAARFKGMVDMTPTVTAEPYIALPRAFRKQQVLVELGKHWQTNRKVKGFVVEKVRGGYAVAIAGYVAFLPLAYNMKHRILSDRFTIQALHPERKQIVVF